MAEHLIRDIRYFERQHENGTLPANRGHLGKLYPLEQPREAVTLGSRFALKLAEQGFR